MDLFIDLAKCLFLNYELCMVRPTLINMDPNKLKYYPCTISLNKCIGSCNVLSLKYVFQKKGKAMEEHISCDCKCKFNSKTCNSKQKWNSKICQCECKKYHKYEKDCCCNSSTCICKNSI